MFGTPFLSSLQFCRCNKIGFSIIDKMGEGLHVVLICKSAGAAGGRGRGQGAPGAGGDQDAIGQVYEHSRAAVYALALSLLKNRQDAEDILHDTYLQIFRVADRYDRQGRPLPWILTIARNQAKMLLRRRTYMETPVEELEFFEGEDPFLTAEDRIVLRAAMEQLEDDEREIIMLHAVAGLKHREIAAQLERPLATVISRYHRAIRKLKAIIEEA